MKLTILKENLKNGLNTVERIVSKSLTLPILNNVLLETIGNFLCLTTTNLEIGIKYWILAKIEKENKTTIPIKPFSNFVSLLPEETISLEIKDKVLNIIGKNYKAQIKCLDPEEFPIIPKFETQNFIEINSVIFCQGLSQVVDFSASSQIRPELSGVYFVFQKDRVYFAATDSFRLAEKTVYYEKSSVFIKGIEEGYSFILPQKTARELIGIFGEKEGKIKIYFSPNQVLFEYILPETAHPQIRLISRLIEGEYPNYQEIIPKKYDTQLILNKNDFLNQIKSASLFSGKTNEVKLKIDRKKQVLEVASQDQEFGEQKSQLFGKINGKETSVSFNFRFLIDGISNITTKDVIFELNGEEGPAVLKPAGDISYIYVVMPIKMS